MAVLPPLEKQLLQSRESDAEFEMSSSSSEEDALEYDMSEDLEDSPAVISPPPSSTPEKANKYKNRRRDSENCGEQSDGALLLGHDHHPARGSVGCRHPHRPRRRLLRRQEETLIGTLR
ncbi:hypothetical protein AVEN_210550-1 [Araneus ventricosus]|uniref:Uncharacterized protein n=1 Tax=Araneus ventricosus TaxID=182803 RepID=A0A4Y2FTD4_ARAVE|nr:hypothetical protein AVEN_210550-1 [Araneus ventricosus]